MTFREFITASIIILFIISITAFFAFLVANAQITHETTITASVPLWYEVTTSTDTVYIRTNGSVKIFNPENNYGK